MNVAKHSRSSVAYRKLNYSIPEHIDFLAVNLEIKNRTQTSAPTKFLQNDQINDQN